jgi:hypothetical protein
VSNTALEPVQIVVSRIIGVVILIFSFYFSSCFMIVTHGANHMDLLVEDDEGELIHERDMNIGYPRLADYCAVIAAPKSGLSTTYNEYDEAEHWRTWWMTEGVEDENGIPVRDDVQVLI